MTKEEAMKLTKGTRIELVSMQDPQAPPIGTLGTVQGVDSIGDLLVKWDNGSRLNVLPEVDEFQIIIEEGPEEEPSSYDKGKQRARQEAKDWQYSFDSHNYSWQELAEWQEHFEKLGKKYGLLREFRENGII